MIESAPKLKMSYAAGEHLHIECQDSEGLFQDINEQRDLEKLC